MKFILKKFSALLNNRFFYALLITLVAFCLSFDYPVYQNEDDQYMRLIAEGAFSNPKAPSEYLLFINVIYGRMLKFLYETFPDLYWYDILFAGLLFISFFIISAVMLVQNSKLSLKILITLVLLLAFQVVFSSLQFTTVSGILACSAMLLLFYVFMQENISRKLYSFTFIYVPFALFMSAQVRFEMMCLTLLCGGVLSLVLINKHVFNKKLFLLCVPVGFGLLISFMANIYNYNEYTKLDTPFNPIDYNNAKSEIMDKALKPLNPVDYYNALFNTSLPAPLNDPLDKADDILTKNGWSKNDIKLIQSWGYTGTGFFNYENMKKMADELGPILQGSWNERLQIFTSKMVDETRYNHVLILLLLIFIGSFPLQMRVAIAHMSFWMIFFFLSFTFKPIPFRVFFSLNILELLFMFLLVRDDFSLKNAAYLFDKMFRFIVNKLPFSVQKFLKLILSGKNVAFGSFAIFIMVVCVCYAHPPYYQITSQNTYKAYNCLDVLSLDEEDIFYNLDFYTFRVSVIPYKKLGLDFVNIYSLGCFTPLPKANPRINREYYDLLINKKIHFISIRPEFYGNELLRNLYVRKFLKEHRNLQCEILWDKHTNHDGLYYYIGHYECEKDGD